MRFLRTLTLFVLATALAVAPINAASNSSRRSAPSGSQIMADGLAAIPGSATSLTTQNCVVWQITVANPTGSAITFNVTDQAAAVTLMAVSVAANTTYVIAFPEGIPLTGIKWSGSSTGMFGEVFGYKRTQ